MYNLQFQSQNLFLKEWFNFAALHFEGNLSIFIDKLMILAMKYGRNLIDSASLGNI